MRSEPTRRYRTLGRSVGQFRSVLIGRKDRDHTPPDWAAGVIDVPGLREVAAWNLMLVLRRR